MFAELLRGELAVAPLDVDLALERVERDLPHHRVDHVLDLGGEHGLALLLVGGLAEQLLEGQHLAEHARGLRQRQRRRRHQRAVRRRQHLVHAVAELMGERHHVARLALIVEQHIRMRRRHGRMRKGAGRLARPRRRVDPAVVEEALGDRRPSSARTRRRRSAPSSRACGQAMVRIATCGSGALRSQCGSCFLPNHFAFSA